MMEVLKPGFFTTFQDQGRIGWLSYGVPLGGAMDFRSARLANAILGNKVDATCVEITDSEFWCRMTKDHSVAVTGALCKVAIDGENVPMNRPVLCGEDSVLSISKPHQGVRVYLGVQGGFDVEKLLGSSSYHDFVLPQSRIKKSEMLAIHTTSQHVEVRTGVKVDTSFLSTMEIEVVVGPEFAKLGFALADFQKEFLLGDNNRMGYFVKTNLKHNYKGMLSSITTPGTVQLTSSGKLIVLMRDAQATGGYPRVLQLTENAINVLSQKRKGDIVRFKFVDVTYSLKKAK